ncbi:MAG: dTMP kinase, partial [Candidatus Rokubacteria bacterium]|nr:dTMP kinase [Candidatus Rokubacteria bacterium]
DLQKIRELNDLATGRLRPDLTIVLDLDVSVGLQRLGGRRLDAFEKMDQAFHARVRQGYLEIAREEKDRVTVIHADQPVESLEAEVWAAVEERLRRIEAVS